MSYRTLAVSILFAVTLTLRAAAAAESLHVVVSDIVTADEQPLGRETPGREARTVAAPASTPASAPAPAPVPDAIVLAGARNGTFSGKLLVSAGGGNGPVEELKAVAGELQYGPRKIPAGAIRIRYGAAWDGIGGFRRPEGLDILLDSPPAGQSLQAIWITVAVPKDAAAGDYAGSITVTAKGAAARTIPLRLHVADWSIPDAKDFATWLEMIQSPDTLAVEYSLPLWSNRHWKMIENSFDLIAPTGSRVVYCPLICHTNLGNAESMVRWIPRSDASRPHEFDFALFDRYLDAAEKHMGRPKIVVLNVWDVYQQEKVLAKGEPRYADANAMRSGRGTGPAVTVLLDAPTGKTETRFLPHFTDPNGAALWAPLFAQLRERLAKRGLEKAMMLGMFTDLAPSREEAAALKQVSDGLPWVCHSHFDPGVRTKDAPELGYRTIHENVVLTFNPAKGRTYGWKESELRAVHYRGSQLDQIHRSTARCLLEEQITGRQRGLGYVGGDTWAALKDSRGQRIGTVTDRYPQSYWRMIEMRSSFLAPGPQGAVITARYVDLCEGLQECEARIFLERALTGAGSRAKLGEDLAGRAQALLDERQHALFRDKGLSDEEIASLGSVVSWIRELKIDGTQLAPRARAGSQWFQRSDWPGRSRRLYDLAAEAARRLAP